MSAYCVGEPVAGSDVGCPGPPGGSTEMSTPCWRSCVATSARSSSVVGGVCRQVLSPVVVRVRGRILPGARAPSFRPPGGSWVDRRANEMARYRPPAMSHDTWTAVDRYVADRLI